MDNKNNLENILDEAITKLQKGFSKKEAFSACPKNQTELAEMLEISEILTSIPKSPAPKPAMRRKYALSASPVSFFGWLHVHKFVSITTPIVVFILLLAGTTYAAMSSVPGQKLFTLKKSSEQLRLKFASSPEAKVNLQVAIAKQRMQEVEKILQNPQRNPETEQVALNELVTTTQNTLEAVNNAAKNKTLSKESYPLVSSLENLTKQQTALVKEIRPESKIAQTTKENENKLSEIKQLIVAAGQEQTLTQLEPGPNTVVISGKIDAVTETNVTVEKTTFSLTKNTIIKNSEEESLTSKDLVAEQQVNILGTKDEGRLIAQRIIIFEKEEQGEVKGEQDEKAENTTTPETIIKKTEDTGSTTKESAIPTINEPEIINPNDIKGIFILEDPKPQTAF